MTQEKMRKMITAIVATAMLLLVILLSVLIYQWITLGTLNRRERKLNQEIARLEQQKEEGTHDAEWYEANMFYLAIEKGWVIQQGDK